MLFRLDDRHDAARLVEILQCDLHACPPQIIGRIEHFVGRKMMAIDGLGGETVAELVGAGLIHNVADLYDLTEEQLLNLGKGWGAKSAHQVIAGIANSKQVPFEQVLFAIGIRHVGETVAKRIARSVGSVQRLAAMTKEELMAVEEVGGVIAQSILDFFGVEGNRSIVERLAEGLPCSKVACVQSGGKCLGAGKVARVPVVDSLGQPVVSAFSSPGNILALRDDGPRGLRFEAIPIQSQALSGTKRMAVDYRNLSEFKGGVTFTGPNGNTIPVEPARNVIPSPFGPSPRG